MKTLTEHLLPLRSTMERAFQRGVAGRKTGEVTFELREARQLYADHRADNFGFARMPQPLLTLPGHNVKLSHGVIPSYGLTLQHYVQRISKRLIINACPHAGDCTKVCVLDNGKGTIESVQRGRRSKTSFLVQQPFAFAYLLGWELEAAWQKNWKTNILFRPNVNSDVRWDLVLPSMVDGSIFGTRIISYGYTKDPFVLDGDGWVFPMTYRLAYSWNESSDPGQAWSFLERGGSVAVVTSRKKGERQPAPFHFPPTDLGHDLFIPWHRVVDADVTDEWMFKSGVIGDLSAKGRARRLIGNSGFVVTTGAAT